VNKGGEAGTPAMHGLEPVCSLQLWPAMKIISLRHAGIACSIIRCPIAPLMPYSTQRSSAKAGVWDVLHYIFLRTYFQINQLYSDTASHHQHIVHLGASHKASTLNAGEGENVEPTVHRMPPKRSGAASVWFLSLFTFKSYTCETLFFPLVSISRCSSCSSNSAAACLVACAVTLFLRRRFYIYK